MMQLIVPRHVYYWVYGALLALTLLTVGVAFLDLGPLNLILALGWGDLVSAPPDLHA